MNAIQSAGTDNLRNYILQAGTNSSSSLEKEIRSKIEKATKEGINLQQEEMLQLQMQIGQYNNLIQMTSSIVKSLTDTEKSIINKM